MKYIKENKKYILYKLVVGSIFFSIIFFASCSKELFEDDINNSDYKLKKVSVNELKNNKKFNAAFYRSTGKLFTNELQRKAVHSRYEENYIFADSMVNIVESNDLMSYNFKIFYPTKPVTDTIYNLVIKEKTADLSEYFITKNLKINNILTPVEITNSNNESKSTLLDCLTFHESPRDFPEVSITIDWYCVESGGGGGGEDNGNNSSGTGDGSGNNGSNNTSNTGSSTGTSSPGGGSNVIVYPNGGSTSTASNPCSTLNKIKLKNQAAYVSNSDNASNPNACDNCENGYVFIMTSNQDPLQPVQLQTSNTNALGIPVGPTIYGANHTHPPSTYQMFSFHDMNTLLSIYLNAHDNIKKHAVFMLNNSDGTNYAILIDNFETFANFMNEQLTDAGINDCKNALDEIERRLESKYRSSNNLEKTFLNFISSAGISLYSPTDANFSNWQKLSLPDIPSKPVVKTPCN